MDSPDELYTLRAQYLLGHYQMALDEAKSISRRPMSADLKAEREELQARILAALHQSDRIQPETPALQAILLKANYEQNTNDSILQQLQQLSGSNPSDARLQMYVSQALLAAGHTKEALMLVNGAHSLESKLLVLQIYLKLDRIDLAQKVLAQLRQKDEDSVVTQLAHVYVALANCQSDDALHYLASLQEQYGGSVFLLNLTAAAHMQAGEYVAAENKLQEAMDEGGSADTLINMIVCLTHQQKSTDETLQQLQQTAPSHPFCESLARVQQAFDREAIKYKVV